MSSSEPGPEPDGSAGIAPGDTSPDSTPGSGAPESTEAPATSNPLRSEADAFRLLSRVIAAALVVIVVALIFGSVAGAVLLILLFAFGGYRSAQWLADGLRPREDPGDGDSPES